LSDTPEFGRYLSARAAAVSISQWKPRSPETSLIAHAKTSSSPDGLRIFFENQIFTLLSEQYFCVFISAP